jgi:FlaA1/EpsC-like NDP-sugar epimerase
MRPIDLNALIGRTPHQPDIDGAASLVAGRTVLVTGAAGSIGSELARIVGEIQAATGEPASRVVCVDRDDNRTFNLVREMRERCPNLRMDFPLVDVADRGGIYRCILGQKPSLVIHAAAYKHVPLMEAQPCAAIVNNVLGTRNVAEACADAGVERLVYISTDKAVDPESVMGATKFLGELICRAKAPAGARWSSVRFGNVLASSCSVLAIWHEQVAAGEPLTLTDPDMTRYFMTIPEAATLALAGAALTPEGEFARWLLDMGEPVRMGDLARRFLDAVGAPDHPIAEVGRRDGEKTHEVLLANEETVEASGQPGVLRIRGCEAVDGGLMDEVRIMGEAVDAGHADYAAEVMCRAVVTQSWRPAYERGCAAGEGAVGEGVTCGSG